MIIEVCFCLVGDKNGRRGVLSVYFIKDSRENYSIIHVVTRAGRKKFSEFNFHGSVHRNNYSNIYPTRYNFTQFILFGSCSTCFGWYLHPSSGAQTAVSTSSGICHTVTAICRYRGRVGTGLSVLWVAYATHSTLKPADSSNGVTNTRCCRYSCLPS